MLGEGAFSTVSSPIFKLVVLQNLSYYADIYNDILLSGHFLIKGVVNVLSRTLDLVKFHRIQGLAVSFSCVSRGLNFFTKLFFLNDN